MRLQDKISDPDKPVIFYEIIPPGVGTGVELQARLDLVRDVAGQVDAINIPEIRQEVRRGARLMRERMEPRAFAKSIEAISSVATIVNRVTVHEDEATQRHWLRDGCNDYRLRNLILVGGEASETCYPGPSVPEAAALVATEKLPLLLGGITIPHRAGEARRVHAKHECGISFFTTQVLLESSHVVQLVRELKDLPVRIVLSFTPVSYAKDLDFLEWLGVRVPHDLRERVRRAGSSEEVIGESIALARQILTEACESRQSRFPSLGLQVERITKRNSAAARLMLTELGGFYSDLLSRRPVTAKPQAARRRSAALRGIAQRSRAD